MGHPGLLIDLLYLAYESTFGRLWFLVSLYIGLDCLVLPTFVHGYGHVKGTQKYIGILSWHGT